MIIKFYNSDIVELNLNKKYLKRRFEKIAFFEKYKVGIINFIFVLDKNIYLLNKKYLNHYYLTDIISFDYSKSVLLEGDLFIGVKTVLKNSAKFNNSFKLELYRVMIHGMLHLMKYNDKKYSEFKLMKKKENYYLKLFII